MCKLFRIIAGKHEEAEYLIKRNSRSETSDNETVDRIAESGRNVRNNSRKTKTNIVWTSFEAYKHIINIIKAQSKHASCPHPYSCTHYVLMVRKIRDEKLSILKVYNSRFYFVLFLRKRIAQKSSVMVSADK